MTSRALIVGLDGADLDVVDALGPSRLPRLHELRTRGAFARLESVRPPATLPNWTTILTGADPGTHGVFDFTTRHGRRVEFTAGTVRATPTIAARLDRLGLACACIGFPGTWPPEQLAHGAFVSGWDAPVAFEADRSFVWPPALFHELRTRFGPWRFDDVDEFHADTDGWHDRLADALVRRIDARTEVLLWLLERRTWDLFACYFGESDTASHHLWSLHDPRSPRRPLDVSERAGSGLARVYEALDVALGRLVAGAGGERVEVTVVSDHGSGGSSDRVVYLNRALADAGLLALRPPTASAAVLGHAKQLGLTRLSPRIRERVFRAFGGALPSLIESRARFGNIDFSRTIAFSDELNYFPAVWLNVRGREPGGQIAPADLARERQRVVDALLGLRDPWSATPLVRAVHAREDLYRGPFVHRAPDLVLELALDRGYSYNVMPTASAPPGTGAWRRLAPSEHLGRKGRSLPGSHRPRGLFVAAGPRVDAVGEIDAHVADVAPTVLARLGIDAPADASGTARACLPDGRAGSRSLPDVPRPPASPGADLSRIAGRLRALGYID